MKFITIVAIISFFALTKGNQYEIDWSNGNYAMQCDWHTDDFYTPITRGEECFAACLRTVGCTHFTWKNLDGGRCYMKTGKVCRNMAYWVPYRSTVCGIVTLCEGVDVSSGNMDGGDGHVLSKGPLLWSDDFDYFGSPDSDHWEAEVGTGENGWGNDELQYYTDNKNALASNGNLVITSKKEDYEGMKYTSSRLVSKKTFKYGIFEMRAKLPKGLGIWSAFWLLSANKPLDWPADGEIDILENVGFDPYTVFSTVHTAKYNHLLGTQIGKKFRVTTPQEFHTYTLDWTPTSIRIYIDNVNMFTYIKSDPSPEAWPFDSEMNILLNVAVGGNFGGILGVNDRIFPTEYVIDYVRHYSNGY